MHLFKYLILVAAVFLACIRAMDEPDDQVGDQIAQFFDPLSNGLVRKTVVKYYGLAPVRLDDDRIHLGGSRYFTRNPWRSIPEPHYGVANDPIEANDFYDRMKEFLLSNRGYAVLGEQAQYMRESLEGLLQRASIVDKTRQRTDLEQLTGLRLVEQLRNGRALQASQEEIRALIRYLISTFGRFLPQRTWILRPGQVLNI